MTRIVETPSVIVEYFNTCQDCGDEFRVDKTAQDEKFCPSCRTKSWEQRCIEESEQHIEALRSLKGYTICKVKIVSPWRRLDSPTLGGFIFETPNGLFRLELEEDMFCTISPILEENIDLKVWE